MKNLTVLIYSVLLISFIVSCASPTGESSLPDFDVFQDDSQEEEAMPESEGDGADGSDEAPEKVNESIVSSAKGRIEYIGFYRPLIDSLLASTFIPADNIQFFKSDAPMISSDSGKSTGTRWININQNYLDRIYRHSSREGILFVLLHEIGHHVLGHTNYDWNFFSRTKAELECDSYAAQEMRMRGIPISKCKSTLREFTRIHVGSGYPSLKDRKKAVEEGYAAADRLIQRIREN